MDNEPTVEGAISRARRVLPEQRIGQVILNAANGQDFFYWSDSQLARRIHEFLDDCLVREYQRAASR